MSSSSLFLLPMENFDEDSLDPSFQLTLIEACRNNDFDAVQAEIAKGTEINHIDDRGCSALHIAVENESFDVLKLLLKQPSIRKDVRCLRGFTPLALACWYHNEVDSILELIAAGCNLDLSNYYGKCPLLLLIENELLEWGKKKIIIEVMIKNGVHLNEPKILKECIIYSNGSKECLEVLHLFLYYNIDVNANGVEPLTFALKYRHFDICDTLWDYIADFTINSDDLLIESLKHGYKFNELLEKGANFSEASIFEVSYALFVMCTSRDANTMERLNYLCMRFHSHDKISFIENVILLFKLMYVDIEDVHLLIENRQHVKRFFHLFFNSAYEAKYNLYDFIYFDFTELYSVLKLLQLDNDEIIQMFYLFLMCTSRISYDQLFSLYGICSKDLFETFLKVNIKITYGRDHFYDYTKFDCILYPDLLPLDMADENVPSLVKLSRNVVRKQFQPDYKTMIKEDLVYFRYYNKVKKLDVPQRIKDILLLNV